MKGRVALSIGVSAAEDKAKCLGVDCEEPVKKIKEEARERLKTLIQEEAKTRRAYEASLQQLKEAREKLVSLQERSQGAGEMQ